MDYNDCLSKYYNFLTDKEYRDGHITMETKDRENNILYKWTNNSSWLLIKKDCDLHYPNSSKKADASDIIDENPEYEIVEEMNFYFHDDDSQLSSMAIEGYTSRLIDKDDKAKFDEFLSCCSKDDKEEGQVAVDDDMVYGVFYGEDIVAVASFWYWGEYIADIGVLTHPDHRSKGLITLAVKNIIAKTDRYVIWRALISNIASNMVAKKCGFLNYCTVYEYSKKKDMNE